jgi:hypothetical protein
MNDYVGVGLSAFNQGAMSAPSYWIAALEIAWPAVLCGGAMAHVAYAMVKRRLLPLPLGEGRG